MLRLSLAAAVLVAGMAVGAVGEETGWEETCATPRRVPAVGEVARDRRTGEEIYWDGFRWRLKGRSGGTYPADGANQRPPELPADWQPLELPGEREQPQGPDPVLQPPKEDEADDPRQVDGGPSAQGGSVEVIILPGSVYDRGGAGSSLAPLARSPVLDPPLSEPPDVLQDPFADRPQWPPPGAERPAPDPAPADRSGDPRADASLSGDSGASGDVSAERPRSWLWSVLTSPVFWSIVSAAAGAAGGGGVTAWLGRLAVERLRVELEGRVAELTGRVRTSAFEPPAVKAVDETRTAPQPPASDPPAGERSLRLGWVDGQVRETANRYVPVLTADNLGEAYKRAIAQYAEANPRLAGVLKALEELAGHIHHGLGVQQRWFGTEETPIVHPAG